MAIKKIQTNISADTPIGQRKTQQREAILQVIADAPGPLSVPEIHEKATEKLESLGIATVYRTLKLLQESEQIHSVILPSGESRFESAEHGHHEHFQCRTCTRVFDVHTCSLPKTRGATLPGGFVIEDHELTFYGTCPDCVK